MVGGRAQGAGPMASTPLRTHMTASLTAEAYWTRMEWQVRT
jgi:hypothetical protein